MRLRLHILLTIALIAIIVGAAQPDMPGLKFNADGTFKILAISDTHFGPNGDDRCIALINMLIDTEKPDLVVVNGDCTTGKPGPGVEDLKKSISFLADTLEKKGVPWAVTFGNHDTEHEVQSSYGISKADHMAFYEAYPHNLNAGWKRGISGVGNKCIEVKGSKGGKTAFAVWLLDSLSDYQNPGTGYEWIKDDQVDWYKNTSLGLETANGKKVYGLMFFHIPLVEIRQMVAGSKVVGVRHEPECPSNTTSKLLPAVIERGDILGMFHGHDHQNNYYGKYQGVMMGYDGVAGYGPYPRIPQDDPANDYIRGGRVFVVREADPTDIKTWMRFAGGQKNWESEAYVKYNKL